MAEQGGRREAKWQRREAEEKLSGRGGRQWRGYWQRRDAEERLSCRGGRESRGYVAEEGGRVQ